LCDRLCWLLGRVSFWSAVEHLHMLHILYHNVHYFTGQLIFLYNAYTFISQKYFSFNKLEQSRPVYILLQRLTINNSNSIMCACSVTEEANKLTNCLHFRPHQMCEMWTTVIDDH